MRIREIFQMWLRLLSLVSNTDYPMQPWGRQIQKRFISFHLRYCEWEINSFPNSFVEDYIFTSLLSNNKSKVNDFHCHFLYLYPVKISLLSRSSSIYLLTLKNRDKDRRRRSREDRVAGLKFESARDRIEAREGESKASIPRLRKEEKRRGRSSSRRLDTPLEVLGRRQPIKAPYLPPTGRIKSARDDDESAERTRGVGEKKVEKRALLCPPSPVCPKLALAHCTTKKQQQQRRARGCKEAR